MKKPSAIRLDSYLKERGLTKQDLALMSGIRRERISAICSGNEIAWPSHIDRINCALGFPDGNMELFEEDSAVDCMIG